MPKNQLSPALGQIDSYVHSSCKFIMILFAEKTFAQMAKWKDLLCILLESAFIAREIYAAPSKSASNRLLCNHNTRNECCSCTISLWIKGRQQLRQAVIHLRHRTDFCAMRLDDNPCHPDEPGNKGSAQYTKSVGADGAQIVRHGGAH